MWPRAKRSFELPSFVLPPQNLKILTQPSSSFVLPSLLSPNCSECILWNENCKKMVMMMYFSKLSFSSSSSSFSLFTFSLFSPFRLKIPCYRSMGFFKKLDDIYARISIFLIWVFSKSLIFFPKFLQNFPQLSKTSKRNLIKQKHNIKMKPNPNPNTNSNKRWWRRRSVATAASRAFCTLLSISPVFLSFVLYTCVMGFCTLVSEKINQFFFSL